MAEPWQAAVRLWIGGVDIENKRIALQAKTSMPQMSLYLGTGAHGIQPLPSVQGERLPDV